MAVGQEVRLGELTEWLVGAVHDSGVADERIRPEFVETWHSRTATLHHFTWPRPALPDVVVKLHRDPAEAATQFHSLAELALQLADDPDSDFVVIKPLAMSSDHGAVLMTHVAGTGLSELLATGDWSSDTFQHDVSKIVNTCGRLLARYHGRRYVVTDDMRRDAHDRLNSRIKGVLDNEISLDAMSADVPVVKSYRDFHPGHIIVTEAGRVAAIDPPVQVRHEYFYRDLAGFSHKLYTGLIQPRGLRTSPQRARHHTPLVTAFLDGYTATTGRALTDDDRFFIDCWEAYNLTRMLRKARQRRRYGRWAYYYVPVQRRRHRLMRRLARHLSSQRS